MTAPTLKAPFPYFGGKSRVTHLVWPHFGDVPNYVEPFCGSLATLLGRENWEGHTETVNDADCYLSNFWRALQADPDATASHADWPVCEIDILARHKWLLEQKDFLKLMREDPSYFDPKIAGWWVWGLCAWIGQGWCRNEADQLPHLGNAGQGINRKLPHLGDAGRGINRKLPHLGDAGRGMQIQEYFRQLQYRLRDVRIACGDWSRVLSPSVTFRHGTTGIFLDPPYGEGAMEYAAGGNDSDIAIQVRDWAIENGTNPLLRIALCGYDGAFEMPEEWECVAWKAPGGFGSQGDGAGRENCKRERIWFSPHCLKLSRQINMFELPQVTI